MNDTPTDSARATFRATGAYPDAPVLPFRGYKLPSEQAAACAEAYAQQADDALAAKGPEAIALALLALVFEVRALRYELGESGGLTADVHVDVHGDCGGA